MAARDFTGAASTSTLTRTRPQRRRHAQPAGGARVTKPHVPHEKSRGRLGSNQVVSVRGRRVPEAKAAEAPRRFSKLSSVGLPLLVAGVLGAMGLSGLATSQSFAIQDLQQQERHLAAEVESLNRDLEQRRSSAELAQQASESGMLVASQPGIIDVADNGATHTRREFNPEQNTKVIDVNSADVDAGRASSDKDATDAIGDRLTATPGGERLGARPPADRVAANEAPAPAQRLDNVAPYQPNVASNF